MDQASTNKGAAPLPDQPAVGAPVYAGGEAGAVAMDSNPHSQYLPPVVDYLQCRNQPPQRWTTGFCDCFSDMTSCCEVLWCSHCQLSYQYHKTTKGVNGIDWMFCAGAYCADILLKGGAYAFLTWDIRNKLRQRFNIDPENSDVAECCKAFCCPSCAACQVYRELSARGYWPGGCIISEPPMYAPQMGGATLMR